MPREGGGAGPPPSFCLRSIEERLAEGEACGLVEVAYVAPDLSGHRAGHDRALLELRAIAARHDDRLQVAVKRGLDFGFDVADGPDGEHVVSIGDEGTGGHHVWSHGLLQEQRQEGESRGNAGRDPARGLVLLGDLVAVVVIEDVASPVWELRA